MRKDNYISEQFKKELWERVAVVYEYKMGKNDKRSWQRGWLVGGAALVMVLSVWLVGKGQEKMEVYGARRELRGVEKEMETVKAMSDLQKVDFESELLALENL